jgi:hypothetical protein
MGGECSMLVGDEKSIHFNREDTREEIKLALVYMEVILRVSWVS